MTMIEGIGDEVLNFFIIVGLLFVGWVAWCSTNIGDQPLIRTVLILQERTRTRIAALRATQAQVLALTQQHNSPDNSDNESRQSNASSNSEVEPRCPDSPLPATSRVSTDTTDAPTATNEEVLIRAMDSFNSEETLLQQDTKVNDVENSSTETNCETDSTKAVVDQTAAEATTVTTESTTASSETEQNESNTANDSEKNISIRLKFINDDQKLVSGNLTEMLGDFKRRHFQLELESRKLVRLIFNGHILQPDEITLEQFGFFDNCVVHCLIHQPRPATNTTNTLDSSSRLYFNPPSYQNIPPDTGLMQTEWDFSRLLVSMVTLILGLAWYFRYHYAQLFTATSTVGLFGLTAIFTVSLFGHLFPDQDSLRNIE